MVVVGSEGEAVTMLVADANQVVHTIGPCVLKGSGKAEMGISTVATSGNRSRRRHSSNNSSSNKIAGTSRGGATGENDAVVAVF